MATPEIIRKITTAQDFATLPVVAGKVLTLLSDDESNVKEIAAVIETDTSLTLKILQVANSPLYALRQPVASVMQAILALGVSRVTNIVLSVSIFSKYLMLARNVNPAFMERYWLHSSSVGMVARVLAAKIGRSFKDTEFLAGLLHDTGKMAMMQFEPELFTESVNMAAMRQKSDIEIEQEIFDADHCIIGATITQMWRLPQEYRIVTEYHHTPDLAPNHRELTAVVRVADMLCEIWGANFYENITELDLASTSAWQILCSSFPKLKDLDVEKFTFELETEFRDAADFLQLMVK
ncbi:hypothetical protein MASR2M18_15090 [Ignavibacteria bacterium]|nr:HDOD domain-containing protein [Bacteroidota bacterium]MCZ2132473.1 HDOD domain-containing protein [Bacteroidota bacterium]